MNIQIFLLIIILTSLLIVRTKIMKQIFLFQEKDTQKTSTEMYLFIGYCCPDTECQNAANNKYLIYFILFYLFNLF